jgi:hypothetical protein
MELVSDVKARLVSMRESGRDNLFHKVQEFCMEKVSPFQIWMIKYRFVVVQGLMGLPTITFICTKLRSSMLPLTRYVLRWIIAFVMLQWRY